MDKMLLSASSVDTRGLPEQPGCAPGRPAEPTPEAPKAAPSSRVGGSPGGAGGVTGTFLHPIQ